MYVIVVYDIGVERVGKICKFMRQYLPRVQNSVFEGELSDSKLERMKAGLRDRMNLDIDSVLIWRMRDAKWAIRETVGLEKLPVSNML